MNKHRMAASKVCPWVAAKAGHCSPLETHHGHGLLQMGDDRSVIALRLGHESIETTQIYLKATLAMKEEALAKATPAHGGPVRYQPGDQL
jgi:integrase